MRNTILIILLIFIMSPVGLFGADDIELPFDYLHGRWVEGHYFDGFLMDSDIDEANYGGNYSYTNSFMQIRLNNLQDYLLFSSQNDSVITAIYNIAFRPTSNWQVSLENFKYIRYEEEYSSSARRVDSKRRFPRYSGSFKSSWINKPLIAINKEHSAHSYFNDLFYSKGVVSINSQIHFSDEDRIDNYSQTMTLQDTLANEYDQFTTDYDHRSKNGIIIFNKLKIGVSNSINLMAELSYSKNSLIYNSFYKSYSYDTLLFESNRIDKDRNDGWVGNVKVRKKINDFYLTGGIGLKAGSNFRKYINYQIDYNPNSTNIYINQYERGLSLLATEYFIGFQYLSDGDFDPNIILADYNNRYRRMLFHKQILLNFDVQKTDYSSIFTDSDFRYDFSFNTRYGIKNIFEVWLAASYKYEKTVFDESYYSFSNFYDSYLDYSIGFSFRSFLFDNKKNDWYNDSRPDIQFGDMLGFGEFYFGLAFDPKSHINSSESLGLFNFSDMKKIGESNLKCELAVGFGRGFELQFLYNENYKGWEYSHVYDLTLFKRIINRFQFRVQATADEFDWFDTDIIELYGGVEVMF